jgi:PAS domain S-box-containing protein
MNAPDKTKKELLDLKSKNARLECINLKIPGNMSPQQISGADKSQPQSFIQTAPSVILYLDRKYRILAINSEAEQINGFKREDILDKNYLELFVPEIIRKKISKNVGKKPGGDQACVFENYIKCADGTERLFSWELNRISGEEELSAGIVAVGKDVTDQQQFYKMACIQRNLAIKLSTINQLDKGLDLCLETAIEVSGMDCGSVYLVDESTGALELVVSQKLSAEFVNGVSHYDADSENTKLVMKGEPVYAEHQELDVLLDQIQKQEKLKAIAVIPVCNEGRVIGCLNIASHFFNKINTQSRLAMEIIAAQIGSTVVRLKTAKALRESEANLKEAQQIAHIGSWRWDLRTNHVEWSDELFRILGFEPYEVKADYSLWFKMIHSDDIEKAEEYAKAAKKGEVEVAVEYRIIRKDKSVRYIYAKGRNHFDSTKPILMTGIVQDITGQKKAEEQLYKSEERFKVLFESAPDAYYIHDLECNMIDINKTAEELVGYSRGEIIGNNFLELNLATEEDIPEVVKALVENQQGKVAGPLELTLYRKDGGKCIVESHSYPVEIDGQTVVLGIARDITERKRLEEAYHSLVDNSLQGLTIVQDGRMVFINKALGFTTGYSEEEILAMSPEQLRLCVHPEDYEMVWSRHQDRLAGRQLPHHYEFRWIRKDGDIAWVEIYANKIEYQGRPAIQTAFIDITERKKAQEALEASKEFAERIIETANAIVVVIDPDGNINTFNKFAEELTGYQKEEVLGKSWFDLLIPENEKESISQVFKKVLVDSPETLSYENYIVTKDGEKRLISWNNHSIRDNEGTIIGNISIGIDITERKKFEEKLIAYQAQLRSLASELSLAEERQRRHIATELHDQISQTLALSKINLQSLGQSAGLTNDSMFTEVIKSIKETIEQVRSLTFDLSSPTLYKFGLEKAIDELLDDYIKKMGVSYILNVDASDKPLEQDIMVLLFQSVRELLINIVKHAQAQKVIVTIDRDGYNIRITVRDDGVGFEAEQFESYEQRTGRFGLFNIQERLSYINGSFKIDSHPGEGSRITLTAPLKIKTDSAKGDF